MLGEKGGNATAFRQNDRRFRNYIMAWQEKGTHRGLLPAAIRSQSAWRHMPLLLEQDVSHYFRDSSLTLYTKHIRKLETRCNLT